MDGNKDGENASVERAELKTDNSTDDYAKSESNVETNGEQATERVKFKEEFSSDNPKSDTLRLLNAIKIQNFGLVSTILENSPKLNIDTPDDVGKTPLHHLCSFGRSSEVAICLRRKPDVNKEDKIGWTPLHHAAMKGYTEIAKLLVDAGSDANKPDAQKGRTPLHLAVWRNHQDIAETLIHCGANTEAEDQDGKTAVHLCRNEYMKNKIETAALSQKYSEKENSESTTETMDIQLDKPTPFPNLGLTVQPVPSEDTKRNSPGGADMRFTMSIRRTPADKADEKFSLEETEDVCSDIFTIKTTRTNGPTFIDISLPILTPPSSGEELVLKSDKQGEEFLITNIKEEDRKSSCIATVDVTSLDSFVVVSRPKLEKFNVGSGAASLKSTVDDRVELDIPKGTFDSPVTITMEITEPPKKDDLKRVMDLCTDIKSTTSFYSLDSGGRPLSKPVSIKVPLPETYSGEGQLLLFTMSDDPSRECPDSWKLMTEANQIRKDRIEFEAPSFSIKVAIEQSEKVPVDMSQFGSSTSFSSIVSQVSRIYRKSRRREHVVTFICMSRRVGTSNTFKTVFACCKTDQRAANVAYWEGEGFENHDNIKLLNNDPEIRVRAKQRFKVTSKDIDVIDRQEDLYLDFQPKLERSYKSIFVKLPTGETIKTGNFEFFKLTKKEASAEGGIEREEEEMVASIEVSLLAFNPNMMDKLDGRSFLTYRRMLELQKGIFDVWWKVLILMDVPFKKIEKTMSDSGSLEEKINGLWFDWKEHNRGDKSRGIPILMSALCRCGKRLVVNDVQKQLRVWKNNPENRSDSFYEWLITAYKYDLLVPTRYDSPMSDTFLAMIADRVKPSSELASALSVPTGTVSDVLVNNKLYPNDGMKTMKILDLFRMGMRDRAAALKKLVESFREMKLIKEADYVIMMTGAWLRRLQDENNEFSEVYKTLTK